MQKRYQLETEQFNLFPEFQSNLFCFLFITMLRAKREIHFRRPSKAKMFKDIL